MSLVLRCSSITGTNGVSSNRKIVQPPNGSIAASQPNYLGDAYVGTEVHEPARSPVQIDIQSLTITPEALTEGLSVLKEVVDAISATNR